jgi:transcriptional regulator with XRE-family HTH domain
MSAINEEQLAAVTPDALWLCSRLREIREVRGMKLTEVGEALGIGHSRVSDTESYRYDVKLSTILRIMSALGITWEQLVKGAPRISQLPKSNLLKNRGTGKPAPRTKKKD